MKCSCSEARRLVNIEVLAIFPEAPDYDQAAYVLDDGTMLEVGHPGRICDHDLIMDHPGTEEAAEAAFIAEKMQQVENGSIFSRGLLEWLDTNGKKLTEDTVLEYGREKQAIVAFAIPSFLKLSGAFRNADCGGDGESGYVSIQVEGPLSMPQAELVAAAINRSLGAEPVSLIVDYGSESTTFEFARKASPERVASLIEKLYAGRRCSCGQV